MPEMKIEPPVTLDLNDVQVAGVKMDLVKREVQITLKVSITPEFMAIRDRLGMLGFSEQPTTVTITGKQRSMDF